MLGHAERILHVDLTARKLETEPLTEELLKKHLDGIGLGMKGLVHIVKEKLAPPPPPLEKPKKPPKKEE